MCSTTNTVMPSLFLSLLLADEKLQCGGEKNPKSYPLKSFLSFQCRLAGDTAALRN